MEYAEYSGGVATGVLSVYFDFLGPPNEVFTYCLLDRWSKDVIKGYGCKFGTSDEIINVIEKLHSEQEATLHVVLNRTSDAGRRKSHIESPRAFVVDIDEPTSFEIISKYQEKFGIHAIIQSSPDKYHLYWKIDESIPLSTWSLYQGALALLFNGDYSLTETTKTLRAPGVPRQLKNSNEIFVPDFCYLKHDRQELNLEDFKKLVPQIDDWLEQYKKESKELKKQFNKALKCNDLVKLGELSGAGVGRNSTIYTAVKTAIAKPYKHLTEAEAVELGVAINQSFSLEIGGPLEESELVKTIESGIVRGQEARERKLEKIKDKMVYTNGNGMPHTEGPTTEDSKEYKYDDLSLANRIIDENEDKFIRVGKVLYVFDKLTNTWQVQSPKAKEYIGFYIKELLVKIFSEYTFNQAYCVDDEGVPSDSKLRNAEHKFKSGRVISTLKTLILEHHNYIRATPSMFDANPEVLYCENGVLDLKELEIRAPKPTDYLLHKTGINWNDEADYSWWEEFLGQVFSNNKNPKEMVAFMQELFGYSLTGSVDAQKIFIHYGYNLNGKSKVLEALRMIGGFYSTIIPCDTLARKGNAIQKEFERIGASVEGKRIVIVDDLDTKTQWNEGVAKSLTAPEIASRWLYEEQRAVPNRAKFHIGCNTIPEVEGLSAGILRRLCIIPYDKVFDADMNKELEIRANLKRFKEGILYWATLGACRVIDRGGIKYPEEMTDVMSEFREDNFKAESLLETLFEHWPNEEELIQKYKDNYTIDSEHWIKIQDLLEYFESICRLQKIPLGIMTRNNLGTILTSKGKFYSVRKNRPHEKKATWYLLKKAPIEVITQNP